MAIGEVYGIGFFAASMGLSFKSSGRSPFS